MLSVSRDKKVGGARRGQSTKNQRTERPYQARALLTTDDSETALKFLLPKISHAGCFIGSGGNAIKELLELTGANIHISGIDDVYPDTMDRVVYITGTFESVSAVQAATWNMIGKIASSPEAIVEWNPKTAVDIEDDVSVEGKITIPIDAAGAIIGKGGSQIQAIMEQSGAQITLNNMRDTPKNTNERVVTISGSVNACIAATDAILLKIAEDATTAQYVTKGTKYPSGASSNVSPINRNQGKPRALSSGMGSSTINLAVPNPKVGSIIGVQGAKLKEIMSVTGAQVVISRQGEYLEGTNDRLVTITGSPTDVRTAQTLINHLVSTAE